MLLLRRLGSRLVRLGAGECHFPLSTLQYFLTLGGAYKYGDMARARKERRQGRAYERV
jgi:hypothetical protein